MNYMEYHQSPTSQEIFSQKKTNESWQEGMKKFSARINHETEAKFVNEESIINMDSFSDVYTDTEIAMDKKVVEDSDRLWSGVEDAEVRKSFILNYGFENESEASITKRLLERYERKKKVGTEVEVAMTFLLQKTLGSDYIVARASVYDDYINGVDTVIVNKTTGEVVAAFDELHNDDLGKRARAKEEKILKKAKRGGTHLKYGFSFDDGKLVKKSLQNLPIFYLGLTTAELHKIYSKMNFNNLDQLIDEERAIMGDLKDSLLLQSKLIMALDSTKPEVKKLQANVEKFQLSFKLFS